MHDNPYASKYLRAGTVSELEEKISAFFEQFPFMSIRNVSYFTEIMSAGQFTNSPILSVIIIYRPVTAFE